MGDCCLEDFYCQLYFPNSTHNIVDCPKESPCVPSNIYCVPEELGDGRCQDYNNGQFCDFDLGDCCLPTKDYQEDCCQCQCQNVDDTVKHYIFEEFMLG